MVALTGPPRYARSQLVYNAAEAALTAVSRKKANAMTTFDKREEAFEQQFAHDEELYFKAIVRRDALLARWAAGKLDKAGEFVELYVNEVLSVEVRGAGPESVFHKLRADFDKSGVKLSDHQIRAKMDSLLLTALADVRAKG